MTYVRIIIDDPNFPALCLYIAAGIIFSILFFSCGDLEYALGIRKKPEPYKLSQEEIDEIKARVSAEMDEEYGITEEFEEMEDSSLEVSIEIEPEEATDPTIVKETIAALIHVGFKKSEAKIAVERVCNNRVYDSVQELITATLDRSNV